MKEFICKNSGKRVKIIPASFRNACKLKVEAMKCLKDSGILIKLKESLGNIQLSALLKELATLVISLDTSEGFNNAIMECLNVCICDNSHAITEQYFNDCPVLWEDYYEIVIACCEVNLRPFFKSLSSELSTLLPQTEELQQQELPQTKASL